MVRTGHMRCDVRCGVDYVADGKFWLKRWLHDGPLLVYATYNCDATDRAVEPSDVNQWRP